MRVNIERLARRLAGYRQGREIADHFFALLSEGDPRESSARINAWLQQAADPRLDTIVQQLRAEMEGKHV